MTRDALIAQLSWVPEAEGAIPPPRTSIVVGGMGGSALPAHAARFLENSFPVSVHSDYDLPERASADALYVAVSYSGNTAETLSFAKAAHERGFPLAVVASGGALADFAREVGAPLVVVPGGVPPRDALFFLLRALLFIASEDELLAALVAAKTEADGGTLADALAGGLPLFYASRKNGFLAHVAKVHLNETAKMPAYANVFPELNHNEMESFDRFAPEAIAVLARFALLRDANDDPRIVRRMDVFTELMHERGRSVTEVALQGTTRADLLVHGWLTAVLAASALAQNRGVEPDAVPLVEDFKKRL